MAYESNRKEYAIEQLAYFHVIIGHDECINICKKFIEDGISNEDNDILSLILSDLLLDDCKYIKFMILNFQKNGKITNPDEIARLHSLLLKFDEKIQVFYRPIINNLLNKYFRTSRKILYINMKKKILKEYIDIFGIK